MSSQNNSRVEADRCNDGVMIPMAGLFSPFLKHSLISMCALTSATFHLFLQITLALKDITNMTREKTARLIPNAIQICTSTEKVYCVGREQSLFHLFDKHILDYCISHYIFTCSSSSLPSRQERKVTRVFSACGKTHCWTR